MTVTTNGHKPATGVATGDLVRQAWSPGKTNAQVAAETGLPERTVSYHTGKLRKGSGKVAKVAEQQPPEVAEDEPSATPRRDPWQVAGALLVLVVGLAVSYSHIVHLALLAGGGWWAWVMPLPLDGMALVSIRHLARERRYFVAWVGVAVGALGSLAANVLAIDPTLADLRYVRWGFAALPPIAVVLCGHLLDRDGRR